MATAEISQLSLGFQTPTGLISALDKVSFSLYPGETLVLLGESGCGKTLTASAVMRLLPPKTLYGYASRITIAEHNLLDLPECLMRQLRGRRVAMIFQEPMTALNPVMTIGAQLTEALLRNQLLRGTALHKALIQILQEVEMQSPEVSLRKYPHQLSGGQKQRVVIAMALACKPEVLIADEPTTALDVTVQAQILALLKKLQKTYGMALLLITHDLNLVRSMADRVCVLYAGQIVEQSLVDDFFKLKHPYVQQLLGSLPSFDKRGYQLSVMQGQVPNLTELPSGCRFHTRCPYAFDLCKQVEPELQPLDEGLIRCHLYPDIQALPPLQNQAIAWSAPEKGPTPTIVSVRNLSVHFTLGGFGQKKSVFKAVDNLSFDLQEGKTLALVGESGCGKTTTSRALLRLIPVAGGTIQFREQDVLALSGRALRQYRKKIHIIFQDPYSSMNPRMTVAEIIAEGMRAQGEPGRTIQSRIRELLDQVHLPSNSLNKYPHQFSGGQRQRICIARALATKPEVLICDESTSALDISVQAQILNLLKSIQQETGTTYLFITHNMALVAYMADDIIVMKDGKCIESGSCEQIIHHPKEAYTKQLIAGAKGKTSFQKPLDN